MDPILLGIVIASGTLSLLSLALSFYNSSLPKRFIERVSARIEEFEESARDLKGEWIEENEKVRSQLGRLARERQRFVEQFGVPNDGDGEQSVSTGGPEGFFGTDPPVPAPQSQSEKLRALRRRVRGSG